MHFCILFTCSPQNESTETWSMKSISHFGFFTIVKKIDFYSHFVFIRRFYFRNKLTLVVIVFFIRSHGNVFFPEFFLRHIVLKHASRVLSKHRLVLIKKIKGSLQQIFCYCETKDFLWKIVIYFLCQSSSILKTVRSIKKALTNNLVL